jgi:signal transduction histidine kinase
MAATTYDRGAKVTCSPLGHVWGDPDAVEQVFANLIGNALNYLDSKRPGVVEIGVAGDVLAPAGDDGRERITFYVRDNGLGIPAAYHGKVFQAHKRLHPEVAKGEGIGLAIVRRTIERHGGSIRFQSAAGEGTTMFFTLPRAESEVLRRESSTQLEEATA